MFAGKDMVNANAAGVLLKLLEKIKTTQSEAESSVEGVSPANSGQDARGATAPDSGACSEPAPCNGPLRRPASEQSDDRAS